MDPSWEDLGRLKSPKILTCKLLWVWEILKKQKEMKISHTRRFFKNQKSVKFDRHKIYLTTKVGTG